MGRRVGVVAIDPSSPFSGGAILGDRIRMGEICGDPGVFVRSMATRGALGGLARGTLDAVDILDAAGYEIVIIETVGVGQDEVDVARAAHTTVVVSTPGWATTSRRSRPASSRSRTSMSSPSRTDPTRTGRSPTSSDAGDRTPIAARGDWQPPVRDLALSGEGIVALSEAIDAHRVALDASGAMAVRRTQINERRLLLAGEEVLRDAFARQRGSHVAGLLAELDARTIGPHTAAKRLLLQLQTEPKA